MAANPRRERVSLTLPPELVDRLEFSRRELSKLTGCELSVSQVTEAILAKSLPQVQEVDG